MHPIQRTKIKNIVKQAVYKYAPNQTMKKSAFDFGTIRETLTSPEALAGLGGAVAGGGLGAVLPYIFIKDKKKAKKWMLLGALLGAVAGAAGGAYGGHEIRRKRDEIRRKRDEERVRQFLKATEPYVQQGIDRFFKIVKGIEGASKVINEVADRVYPPHRYSYLWSPQTRLTGADFLKAYKALAEGFGLDINKRIPPRPYYFFPKDLTTGDEFPLRVDTVLDLPEEERQLLLNVLREAGDRAAARWALGGKDYAEAGVRPPANYIEGPLSELRQFYLSRFGTPYPDARQVEALRQFIKESPLRNNFRMEYLDRLLDYLSKSWEEY